MNRADKTAVKTVMAPTARAGDWWGRALWGLGTSAARSRYGWIRDESLSRFEIGALHRSSSRRAMAFAGLGAAEVLSCGVLLCNDVLTIPTASAMRPSASPSPSSRRHLRRCGATLFWASFHLWASAGTQLQQLRHGVVRVAQDGYTAVTRNPPPVNPPGATATPLDAGIRLLYSITAAAPELTLTHPKTSAGHRMSLPLVSDQLGRFGFEACRLSQA